jgi:hypothetical protein
MLKTTLLAASLVLASAPLGFAQDMPMACDADTFLKMDTQVDSMSAESQQDMKNKAAQEMAMAKDAMDKKDDAGCMEHLQKASDVINMKM